jgi:NAD(P)-dependent dehydrogenase (short-subunit alcohol dehydrogenase family)
MKTILICGYGPGISNAVARKFGAEGFAVALVARSAEKLADATDALVAKGVRAQAFPCDLSDAAAVKQLVSAVHISLGPITVLHWNAYGGGSGDLTTGSLSGLRRALDIGVTSLAAATQAALPDLESQKDSAILVTGGGLAFYNDNVDAAAAQWGMMDLAVSKAAQHKLVGVLAAKLAPKGVYVGEVVVSGVVKGTAFDSGSGTLEPDDIAAKFWSLYTARAPRSVTVG